MKLKRNIAILVLAGSAMSVNAAGILSNGEVAIGVKDSGALNVSHRGATIYGPTYDLSEAGTSPGTGVRGIFLNDGDGDGLKGGYEATYPGCTCEGWGVAVASLGITGYDGNGYSNISLVSSSFGTDGAGSGIGTTVVTIADATGKAVLEVTHDFKPSASKYLYEAVVTIKNISGADLGTGSTDLRYTRLMDWDTEPTPFSEFVTIEGNSATNLLYTNDDGFERADPLFAGTSSIAACAPEGTDFIDCGPRDHGARFDFGFDALLALDDPETKLDETMRSLTIFYGAAPTEALADTARAVVGAEVYSYGQCNPSTAACSTSAGTPLTYIFGFKGVGGTPPPPPGVPEPASLMLMGLGLVGLSFSRRRKTC